MNEKKRPLSIKEGVSSYEGEALLKGKRAYLWFEETLIYSLSCDY